ncbi:hypothetical protein RJ55_04915 [Drechmeria coniospora]|nr:hypothetical protein RJ55_04915 [Drechmeria coniospora]
MLRRLFLLALGSRLTAGGIIVSIGTVAPLPLAKPGAVSVSSSTELFQRSCPEEVDFEQGGRNATVLLSGNALFSMNDEKAPSDGAIFPSSDSLIRGTMEAWTQHQHLVLRPDIIWFEVLAQLNLYMTKHTDEIRRLFVEFEGPREVLVRGLSRREVLEGLERALRSRVKADWLLDWISPDFSTTTENDKLTANVLTVGRVQHHVHFHGGIVCGLPSVQLLGRRQDWLKLRRKLERLKEFGAEPRSYYGKLEPIFQGFVQTWDDPESDDVKDFWLQIVRANRGDSCGMGSGDYRMSGWITGFLHWKQDGSVQDAQGAIQASGGDVKLDSMTYMSRSLDGIPVGYAKVPVKLLDHPLQGLDTNAFVLGGNIGVRRTETSAEGTSADGRKGVLAQPLSAWFLYEAVEQEETRGLGGYGSMRELYDIRDALSKSESCLAKYPHVALNVTKS